MITGKHIATLQLVDASQRDVRREVKRIELLQTLGQLETYWIRRHRYREQDNVLKFEVKC